MALLGCGNKLRWEKTKEVMRGVASQQGDCCWKQLGVVWLQNLCESAGPTELMGMRSAFLDEKTSSRGRGAEEQQTTAKTAFFIQVQSPAAGVPVHGVCHRPTPAMPSSDMQEPNHGCAVKWAATALW